MRHAYLYCLACIAMLAAERGAGAGEAWKLDRHAGDEGKGCSLSRTDGGRLFSVTLAFLPDTTDQGVVSLAFDEPELIQGAKKALATLKFDNRKRQSHRIEMTPDGGLLVPIVSLKMQRFLQTLSETSELTIATRHGSTSFNLDGIAAHIADLRDCAGS
jgi:hypothetical protein